MEQWDMTGMKCNIQVYKTKGRVNVNFGQIILTLMSEFLEELVGRLCSLWAELG